MAHFDASNYWARKFRELSASYKRLMQENSNLQEENALLRNKLATCTCDARASISSTTPDDDESNSYEVCLDNGDADPEPEAILPHDFEDFDDDNFTIEPSLYDFRSETSSSSSKNVQPANTSTPKTPTAASPALTLKTYSVQHPLKTYSPPVVTTTHTIKAGNLVKVLPGSTKSIDLPDTRTVDIDSDELLIHRTRMINGYFRCPLPNCPSENKDFLSKYQLKRHYDIVHSRVRWPCPICKKLYTRKDHLKLHGRTVHRKNLDVSEVEPVKELEH